MIFLNRYRQVTEKKLLNIPYKYFCWAFIYIRYHNIKFFLQWERRDAIILTLDCDFAAIKKHGELNFPKVYLQPS